MASGATRRGPRRSAASMLGDFDPPCRSQLAAIEAYAKAAGYDIVETFYDAAVSGHWRPARPRRLRAYAQPALRVRPEPPAAEEPSFVGNICLSHGSMSGYH